MEKKKSKRNGLVDIMRLVFAGIVMMFHFYSSGEKHFVGGKFGVEYFVILSGFLLFRAWDRQRPVLLSVEERQGYWMSYMKKRYVRFFWYSLIAFTGTFLVARIWLGQVDSLSELFDKLSGDIWEILLVKMNGFNRGKSLLNGPAWTLSCMLLSEFFILGMLTFFERPFLTFLMPLSVVIGTGYWINIEKASVTIMLTYITFGMLRVYLLTCFGIFSYQIYKRLREVPFSKAGRWMLSVLELFGYAACVWIACFQSSRNYQFCFILIATFVLAVSFSGKSFAGSLLPANTFTNFCAELSLSLYLTHSAVLRIFRYAYEDINDLYRQKFMFAACALAAALAYTFIMRGLFKMLPNAEHKLKSVILEQT